MGDEERLPEIPGYRLLRRIGAGGMGSVYEGEKLATHETFAVKVIHERLASDASYAARFEREVNALRRIRHPNVVEVYEWSLPPAGGTGQRFVVMELLDGETLQQLLLRAPALPPARCVAVALQILDGLAAAHEVGVVHRDLAPSNVFLAARPDGKLRVKLLDFGLTRPLPWEPAEASVTEPGTFMGKPAYMAPEQFLERSAGEAADVFACGMMLYRMLTGKLPYRAVSAQMLWNERLAERESPEEYLSPQAFVPALPDALAGAVSRAIRKRPEDRIASARDFQRLLLSVETSLAQEMPSSTVSRLAVLAGEAQPPLVPRASTLPVAAATFRRRRGRRRAWLAAAGLAAAGAVAAGLVAAAWRLTTAASSAGRAGSPGATAGHESRHARASPAAPVAGQRGSPADAAGAVRGTAAGVDAGGTTGAGSRPDAGWATEAPGPVGLGGTAVAAVEHHADAGAGVPSPEAPDAAPSPPPTVRFRFVGLPANAAAYVDGRPVGPEGVADVPRSDVPVEVSVVAAGGAREPYVDRVVPDRDRTIRVPFPSTGPPRARPDAGAGTLRTDEGTVFATQWR